jgi:hypothetical protein
MAKLNTRSGTRIRNHFGNCRNAFRVRIAPEPEVSGRDPAICRHSCGLNHDKARTTAGQSRVMRNVPVSDQTILGLVLAHR